MSFDDFLYHNFGFSIQFCLFSLLFKIISSTKEVVFSSVSIYRLVGWFLSLSAGLQKKTAEQIRYFDGGWN